MTAENKPKILLITRNFPPLTGGMERLMQKAAEGIAGYADLTIIGPKGCGQFSPPEALVHEVPEKLLPFLCLGFFAGWQVCRDKKIDCIIGGSGLTGPILLLLKALFKSPTVLFIHGLDIVVNSKTYQNTFLPCIRRADLLIANSNNTRSLAIQRGVENKSIAVINPATDLPDLDSIEPAFRFCQRLNLSYPQRILFTGRITKRKGLSKFITNCLPLLVDKYPDLGLIIVGENPDHGLTRNGEKQAILEILNNSHLQRNVEFLGQVSEETLAAAYASSDLQIFPLIDVKGDVEGFGMVAIEAAACGTPTIAFRTGGIEDAISDKNGTLIEPGDYKKFSEEILKALRRTAKDGKSCREHAEGYSWPRFHSQLQQTIGDHLDIKV